MTNGRIAFTKIDHGKAAERLLFLFHCNKGEGKTRVEVFVKNCFWRASAAFTKSNLSVVSESFHSTLMKFQSKISMRNLLTIVICLSFVSGILSAQSDGKFVDSRSGGIEIFGRVLDEFTHQPIAYANIGVIGSNVGTISDLDGDFRMVFQQDMFSDSVSISALGYGRRLIPLKILIEHNGRAILLPRKEKVLGEVQIEGKIEKNRVFQLGNPRSKGGVLETDTVYAGRSISLLIENREPNFKKKLQFPVYLKTARLKIFRNNLDSIKFRIRVNRVDDETGEPGFDMFHESFVVTSEIRNGWIEFDLSNHRILVDGPFYVTFEQIFDSQDRQLIASGFREFMEKHPEDIKIDTLEFDGKKEVRKRFTGSGIDLPGTFVAILPSNNNSQGFTCYVREVSFGEWKKVRGIVTATVELSNQPISFEMASEDFPCENELSCKLDRKLDDFVYSTNTPGCQLLVSQFGRTIFKSNKGYSDIARQLSVSDSTRFRINSISKSITSVGLVKLAVNGKLDLDNPIQKYLPEYPVKDFSVTTRHLGGHLSGIRHYNEDDPSDFQREKHYNNSRQAIEIFMDDSLLFEPGSQFHYSTYGFNLIGAIVESVSGKNFLDFLKDEVFVPIGMDATSGDNRMVNIPNRAKFYDLTGNENELGDWSYKYPGGGILSTANDLSKFGHYVLNLTAKEKEMLFTSMTTNDGEDTGYGIGWYVGKDKRNRTIWYHSGDSFSSSSHMVLYPEYDVVVVFLSNSQDGAAFDVFSIGDMVCNQ